MLRHTYPRQTMGDGTLPGPRSPIGRTTMSGYLHRVELRAIGLTSRRRYWFALAESSHYLYWFKERDDVGCVGRLSLTGAAFTYNPREKGRFEIHAGAEVHVLECASDKSRDEWMHCLQDTRKRSRVVASHHTDESKEIISLSSTSHSQIDSPSPVAEDQPGPSTSQSSQNLIDHLLGPISSGSSTDSDDTETKPGIHKQESSEADLDLTTPSSTFYLSTDGQLNDKSMQMPKAVVGAEAVLQRLADRTNESFVERPMRALDKARKSLRGMAGIDCEECRKRSSSWEDSEQRCHDLEDQVTSLEDVVRVLKTGLLTAQKQVDTMKHLQGISGDEDVREFLLEKEKVMTSLQMDNNQLNRRLQLVESENRDLDQKVAELNSSVEAFRDSVRTKEELIMRLCEENAADGIESQVLIGDVEVPEGILIDVDSVIICDEAAQMVFDTEGVRDVNELKDLVEGYKAQNSFLNQEIIELHSIVQSLEARERQLIRKNFDVEACYYQLKSRYLMVLNHFKSPEKPGKIMEAGVLRELLEEANRTPREAHHGETDHLGFYLKGKTDMKSLNTPTAKAGDLLDTAAGYMERANDIVEATRLEQSEGYMLWLQSWDALLVNWVGRPLAASTELKNLVRSGIPPAYRARVWKSLVLFSVKDKMAELGNSYFDCMLKKAKTKKAEGLYDSAIKQIDLDLARTLPTNKHFDDPDSGKIEQLRRVLYAFRYHNKEVGYCQGLNRLAAIALLNLEEEDAFWFMVACVEHLQPEGYYTSTLIGAVADQKVLRDLVADKLPKLAAHLRHLEVDLSLFALSWFLTCFVDILPHSVYLSIFDIFLYEGNKVLFRFALALLKQCEAAVLQCRTIGTVHACLSRASECVDDFRSLAQIAFNDLNPFPQKMIETKRSLYLSQLKDQGSH